MAGVLATMLRRQQTAWTRHARRIGMAAST
jgi:hypothetical protein